MRNDDRIARGATVLLGLFFLPVGIEALLLPHSFYDDFPLDRSWIVSTGGAYNEHLVRDVGGLFLALALVSIWAWWRPSLCRPVACAWLLEGTPHLVFHLSHLHELDGVDAAAMIVSLVAPLAVASFVLLRDAAGFSRRRE